jgi:serine/threonine-protein kinase
VIAAIGAGGMGEVYRARDTTLQRDVGIKVLPEAFAADADRLARFRREAQALAALNHPNIAQVYGFEGTAPLDGAGAAIGASRMALVMEFVDGEDLAARLARGPMAIDDAMLVARQIADGLEFAHENGIVHRDLKPPNIKITPTSRVKILDFGLAKAMAADPSSSNVMNSPTLTARATEAGMILGTAAYMSPEQARGRAVDKRTDIWAFGAVLFEMLTGRRAFEGDTVSDTLAAVLKTDPDWSQLPPAMPAHLQALLKRCLERDVTRRLRDIGEARVWLDAPDSLPASSVSSVSGIGAPAARRSLWSRLAWPAAMAAAVAVTGVVVWQLRAPADPPLRRFVLPTPGGAPPLTGAISPDGRFVGFVAADKAWLQKLDEYATTEIPNSVGAHAVFWSPDSSHVGYQARGQLWKVAVAGGPPIAIGRVSQEFTVAGGAAWLEDGRIIFTTGGTGLLEIPDRGGEAKPFLEVDPSTETDFHNVAALPGGRGLLFVTHTAKSSNWPLEVYALADGRRTTLVSGSSIARPFYSPTGHILFEQDGGVRALPFSLARMAAEGDPFLVAAGAGEPTVSRDNSLLMVPGAGFSADLRLARVNRAGQLDTISGQPNAATMHPRLSPDGRLIAATVGSQGESDIWIFDLQRATDRRLTFEPGIDTMPAWTPDGRFVVYQCGNAACARQADGGGSRLDLLEAPVMAPLVSPDGRSLLFLRENKPGDIDVWSVELGAGGVTAKPTAAPRVVISGERLQRQVDISPDGRFAVYGSSEGGTFGVYVTRFPSGEGKWEVSRGFGVWPRWSARGDRLYFADELYRIVELEVDLKTTFTAGAVNRIVSNGFPWAGFDRALDGQSFIVPRSANQSGQTANLLLVQNWFQPAAK